MLYRIVTENKNRDRIEGLIADKFEGFTVISAKGYYKNKAEKSLIIEVCSNELSDFDKLTELAGKIKEVNKQESVLVQKVYADFSFV